MKKNFMSVVIPTHNHAWELDVTMYSLSRQYGIMPDEYEILIVNTNPEDKETYSIAEKYSKKNIVRLIQVYDERAKTIKNACYGGNLGARSYARGNILMMVVDSARVPTPGVLRKSRDCFERFGDRIVTTTIPYHFYKHSSVPGFTVEECREKFLSTRWKQDMYCLFDYAADTNISSSGIPNESTWLGVTKDNFIRVRGYNEFYKTWSDYNLDLWRRLTRDLPKDGVQAPGYVNDNWGKIGFGLKYYVLEGEADFHLHHSLSDANRDFSVLKRLRKEVWEEYEKIGDCIVANITRSDWGRGDSEEIYFNNQ